MKYWMACACLLLAACDRGDTQALSVTLSAAGDDLTMLVGNHVGDTVRVENIDVVAPSATAPGVVFAIRDAAGGAIARCGVPLPAQGAAPTGTEMWPGTMSMHTFHVSTLARTYCLSPGEYRVTATLRQRDGAYVSNAAPFRVHAYIPLPVAKRCTLRVPRDYHRVASPAGVVTYSKGEDEVDRIIASDAAKAGHTHADPDMLRADGWAHAGKDVMWAYQAVPWKGQRVEMFHIMFPQQEIMVAGRDTAGYRAILADCLPPGLPASLVPEDVEIRE